MSRDPIGGRVLRLFQSIFVGPKVLEEDVKKVETESDAESVGIEDPEAAAAEQEALFNEWCKRVVVLDSFNAADAAGKRALLLGASPLQLAYIYNADRDQQKAIDEMVPELKQSIKEGRAAYALEKKRFYQLSVRLTS